MSWQGHWGRGKELKGETERMARELRDNRLRRGEVRRVARGLCRRTNRPVTEMETLLMVARMVPDGAAH